MTDDARRRAERKALRIIARAIERSVDAPMPVWPKENWATLFGEIHHLCRMTLARRKRIMR